MTLQEQPVVQVRLVFGDLLSPAIKEAHCRRPPIENKRENKATTRHAIVNAGNETLLGCFTKGHQCLDHQIHEQAGSELTVACAQTMALLAKKSAEPGDVILTLAYGNLVRNGVCDFVLHTVGPNASIHGVSDASDELLARCYRNCLDLASSVPGLCSVAFPCLSTGLYGYPAERAARVAMETVLEWAKTNSKSALRHIDLVVHPNDARNCIAYRRYSCSSKKSNSVVPS